MHDHVVSSRARVSLLQDSLQWCQCCCWKTDKNGVAVVHAEEYEGRDESCRDITAELSTNGA